MTTSRVGRPHSEACCFVTSLCFNRGNHHPRVTRILPRHRRASPLIAIAPVPSPCAPLPIQTLHQALQLWDTESVIETLSSFSKKKQADTQGSCRFPTAVRSEPDCHYGVSFEFNFGRRSRRYPTQGKHNQSARRNCD